MSLKWTGSQSESGILRRSEFKEKKEELFVFGYSCKLFRDNDKALHIDQGKHLIPWMGDESLKIDRYDARGALHDLSALEAPPGGYDWRVELTRAEQDVEQLCDEERYRALHTDEDEEEMYKEEELKRLHAAGYGQVGFNYDAPAENSPASQPVEVDELFEPTPSFKALLPADIVMPETQKQNAIIEKTAKFIASQGAQMEILIKAKQRDNPQFLFLAKDSELHPYYSTLIGLVKAGKWPEKVDLIEEKPPEPDEYLHPSLGSTIIELAPSIPSIQYKPSADCDYTLLISRMRGDATLDEPYSPELAPGEVAPPGTEPLPPRRRADISHAPVMYNTAPAPAPSLAPTPAGNPVAPPGQVAHYQQYAAYYHQYMAQAAAAQPQPEPVKKLPPPVSSLKSTGLSLMKNYNTDSDSDASDFDDTSSSDSKDKPTIVTPPDDVQVVIDKMAAYVARNGDEFADIVRAKNDPRFTFLEPDNVHYAFYKKLMYEKRGIDVNGKGKKGKGRKSAIPVSFSIKKLKEPDPILPKPALPYESSSDEDSEKHTDKQADKTEETKELPKIVPQLCPPSNLPGSNMPASNVPRSYVSAGNTPDTLLPFTNLPPSNLPPSNMPLSNLTTSNMPPSNMPPSNMPPSNMPPSNMPPIIVYKMEGQLTHDLPTVSTFEHVNCNILKNMQKITTEVEKTPKQEHNQSEQVPNKIPEANKERTPVEERRVEKVREATPVQRREKRKHRERKSERSSTSGNRDRRSERIPDREKKREKDERKRSKYSKEELETEIISLVDNSDDLIDLTGDQSDSKVECDAEVERAKQQERRRRAAEFLKKVGVDPAAAALPTSSLASAMVDTLESIRKKKAEEEEKRRRREKRRHRDRREHENESERHRRSKRRKYRSSEDEESDCDGSKKKKRKRDKRHTSKNKRKRRKETEMEEEDHPLPPNIDLTNTLKELRTSSPTKELGLRAVEENTLPNFRQESSDECEEESIEEKKTKENREYSEGEWSSDSEGDSRSSGSKRE